MNFGPFMAALQPGKLKHIYLLSGEENYFIDKAQQKLFKCLFASAQDKQDSLYKRNNDIDPDDLIALIETQPFFTEKNVILLQNSDLLKDSKKNTEGDTNRSDKKLARLQAVLENMPDYSYVIFITRAKCDKRRKLYKIIEKYGAVLEAEPLRPWTVNEWLQGKLQSIQRDLDREALAYFNIAVSMMQQVSLEFLDQEFDKLALFTERKIITKSDVAAVFASVPEVSVFAILDAISERSPRKALHLLRRQLADGTYFTVILSLLTRHVRQLWQARVWQAKGVTGKALAKPLELNPYIAERLGRAAGNFSPALLKSVMLELIDADYYLKTGQAGDEILEHAVIRLCTE